MHWRSSGGQGGYAAFIAGITEAKRRGPDSGAMTGPSSPKSSKDSGGYRAHGGYIDFI